MWTHLPKLSTVPTVSKSPVCYVSTSHGSVLALLFNHGIVCKCVVHAVYPLHMIKQSSYFITFGVHTQINSEVKSENGFASQNQNSQKFVFTFHGRWTTIKSLDRKILEWWVHLDKMVRERGKNTLHSVASLLTEAALYKLLTLHPYTL